MVSCFHQHDKAKNVIVSYCRSMSTSNPLRESLLEEDDFAQVARLRYFKIAHHFIIGLIER